MRLITTPNLEAPDDFYEALIDTHRDLEGDASHALNARLVLLLANHCSRRWPPHAQTRDERDSPRQSMIDNGRAPLQFGRMA